MALLTKNVTKCRGLRLDSQECHIVIIFCLQSTFVVDLTDLSNVIIGIWRKHLIKPTGLRTW